MAFMETRSSSRLVEKQSSSKVHSTKASSIAKTLPQPQRAPEKAASISKKRKRSALEEADSSEESNTMERKATPKSKRTKSEAAEASPVDPTQALPEQKTKQKKALSTPKRSRSSNMRSSATATAFDPTQSTQEATQALLKLYKRLVDAEIEKEGYSGTRSRFL